MAQLTKLRFSPAGITAYAQVGEIMSAKGYKPLRCIEDPDAHSALTWWITGQAGGSVVITQVWVDTGGVNYYENTTVEALGEQT